MNSPVVMIGKSWCPYCVKAEKILKAQYADTIYKQIDKLLKDDEVAAVQAYCKQITGGSSVPRVFIGGKFIGGCDDTEAKNNKGELKQLIDAATKK